MPTYDYICPNGHRFEVIHSISAAAPDACPICGASPVRKGFSAPSVHFKGSGWAKKDRSASSRSAARAASDGADSATTPDAESSGSEAVAGSATDASKPAAKPAPETKGSGHDGAKPAGGSTASGSAPAD